MRLPDKAISFTFLLVCLLSVYSPLLLAQTSTPTPVICSDFLQLTDVEEINIAHPRGAGSYDAAFLFTDLAGSVPAWCLVYDNENTLYDMYDGWGQVKIRSIILTGTSTQAGDNILLTYDGNQKKRIYLPVMTGYNELYVGSDGSTYYDQWLCQTAQVALAPSPTPTPTLTPTPTCVCTQPPTSTPTPISYRTATPSPSTTPTPICFCCPIYTGYPVTLSDQTSTAPAGEYDPCTCRGIGNISWWTSGTNADWVEIIPVEGLNWNYYHMFVALGDTSLLSPGQHQADIFILDNCGGIFGEFHVNYDKPAPSTTPSPIPTPSPTSKIITPTPFPTATATPMITPTPSPSATGIFPTPETTPSTSCDYQVSGYVRDSNTLEPIPGADVWLEFSDHSIYGYGESATNGWYEIWTCTPRPPGTVLAWASHSDYITGSGATVWGCYLYTDANIELDRILTPTPTSTPFATPTVTPTPYCMNYGWFVINEVGWAGTSASPQDEWIEIYNVDGFPASGQTLSLYKDGGATPVASLSAGFTGYAILERDNDSTISDVAAAAFFTCTLSDQGEVFNLYLDPTGPMGCEVDILDCSSGWFAGTSAGYYSMERVTSNVWAMSGNNPANWANNNPVIAHNGKDANSDGINGTAAALNSASYPNPTLTPSPSSRIFTPTPSPTIAMATPTPSPTSTPIIPAPSPSATTCPVCDVEVSGYVRDGITFSPLSGATVELETVIMTSSDTTDAEGYYSVTGYSCEYYPHWPPLPASLNVSAVGYFNSSTDFQIRCYTPLVRDFDLTPILPAAIDSGDYNGDGTSDIAIFRAGSGLWSVRGVTRFYFGSSDDIPVSGDYDGDGTTDIGIFRGSSGLWGLRDLTRTYYGSVSDIPLVGDYDEDGTCDIGVFRSANGLWAVKGLTRVYFGGSGDTAVPGDYDGDGVKDLAIFRRSSGLWALRSISRFYFGGTGDTAVPGDYDGQGTWQPGIFRPSSGMWELRGITRVYYGSAGDQAVPADYDGYLADDVGIFRPSSGLWAIRDLTRTYFGSSGDLPVTR